MLPHVPKISMYVPDVDLALIDEVAAPNRTAFMLDAARVAVARVQAERLDREIAACLVETSHDDRALAEEFSSAAADGL